MQTELLLEDELDQRAQGDGDTGDPLRPPLRPAARVPGILGHLALLIARLLGPSLTRSALG